MTPVKGICVSVGYDDLLALTLLKNARHLTSIVVVTTREDARTQAIVARVPSARCFFTDAFTRHGARFNKGAALEEGFDALGRDGWILIHDADILLPDSVPFNNLDPSKLYGAPRRMLDDPKQAVPASWRTLPLSKEVGFPGYFQLFHGSNPLLTRPWYDVTYTHAGGGDGYFQSRFKDKAQLPMEVLHYGPRDTNWFGRASERLDGDEPPSDTNEMEKLQTMYGWGRPRKPVPGFTDRVSPPR